MSVLIDEVSEEECEKCLKDQKLNSHGTNECYTCRQSRKRNPILIEK